PSPARCLPPCTSNAPWDMQDPAAHRRLPPSSLPITPPSSPSPARRRSLPAHPASLPAPADSAPADWPAGSAPHNLSPHLRKPPPPPPESSPPALRTTHARTCPSDTSPPSRSTHTKPVAAPPPPKGPFHLPSGFPQLPSLPTTCESIPDSALPSIARTTL